MSQARILSIGPLPQYVKEAFTPGWEVICVGDSAREELLELLDDRVQLLIARGPVHVDSEILDRAPNLKAVARTGVGYDTVDIEAASARRVPVLYTPGAMSRAVAEITLAFMLAATKKLMYWREALLQGNWDARYGTYNLDLQGASLGIVGYGRIGSQVRILARPFEMTVFADDPYIDHSLFRDDDITFVDLEETLSRCSIVTLHVPLTEETRGLINRSNISLLQPGSILINTARGSVIESLDLVVEALETGRLAAAALDVYPQEPPPPDHPILSHPRAIVTNHIAARTPLAQRRILETMLGDSLAVLHRNQPNPDHVVNPEVLP